MKIELRSVWDLMDVPPEHLDDALGFVKASVRWMRPDVTGWLAQDRTKPILYETPDERTEAIDFADKEKAAQ